ncbi:hypothetical protein AB0L53_36745 [Nonomuraea sp. NPDC052129]|uniref:sensor histidine kinase n=1 Tax=Nonomuraea sp. NPDC052129 TaxID=3154651 RepID=UPI003439FF0A
MKGRFPRAVRAGIYQLLGAALLTPMAVALGLVILAEQTPVRVFALWAACLPASMLLAAVPLMRRLERAALSELLGVDVPQGTDRLYLAALTSLHLYGGATLGAGVLLLSPGLVRLGDVSRWRAAPGELTQVCILAAVTLAAMAAQAALQKARVPEVGDSLSHLTNTARNAQQDLDVLLRVLDDGDPAETPTLGSLRELIRGLDVRANVGRLDRVPAATSRVAFAIAREALTNALRHGQGPIVIDVATGDNLILTVDNKTTDTSPRPGREGRGLTGMRMRARLAGGTFVHKKMEGTWRIQATLPL